MTKQQQTLNKKRAAKQERLNRKMNARYQLHIQEPDEGDRAAANLLRSDPLSKLSNPVRKGLRPVTLLFSKALKKDALDKYEAKLSGMTLRQVNSEWVANERDARVWRGRMARSAIPEMQEAFRAKLDVCSTCAMLAKEELCRRTAPKEVNA